jgi:hypothetical protein
LSNFLQRIVCISLHRFFFGVLIFFLEFFVFPGAVIEGGDGGAARVEDDVVFVGTELGAAKVGAGGLQSVEKKGGGRPVGS